MARRLHRAVRSPAELRNSRSRKIGRPRASARAAPTRQNV